MSRPHAHATVLDSSVLSAMTYSLDATLELVFRSGRIYRYFTVPPPIVESLIAAKSKGVYFNSRIRGRFRYQRLT